MKFVVRYYSIYRLIVIAVTLVSLASGLFVSHKNGYDLIWSLPLLYLLYLFSTFRINRYIKKNFGLFLLDIFLFIKYSIVNLVIILTSDYTYAGYTGTVPSASSNHEAILISLIEMTGLFLAIHIFAPVFYKKKIIDEVNNDDRKTLPQRLAFSDRPVAILIVIFTIVLASIFNKIFIPQQLFFLSEGYVAPDSSFAFGGLVLMFFQAAKILIAWMIINEMVYRYQSSQKFRYIAWSYFTIMVYAVLSTGTSRTGLLIPFIIFFFITYPYFKKRSLVILVVAVPVITASLISISAFKQEWLVNSSQDSSLTSSVVKAGLLQTQEYTSGIRPTALGIETSRQYEKSITLKTFVDDFAGSIPFVSEYVDQNDRINVYYNKFVFGTNSENTSLIMPLSSISFAYFGIFGSWFFSVICVIILMSVDSRKQKSNLIDRYLKAYLVYVLAFAVFSNTQMVFGRIVTIYLPTLALFYLIKKINTEKNVNHNKAIDA